MSEPVIWGLAGFLAACFEAVAFNSLTVMRSRAHAGQTAPIGETWGQQATRGLWAQLIITAVKRGTSFGLWRYCYLMGWSSWLSGGLIGALEASVLTPFRRVLVCQQGFSVAESTWSILRRAYKAGGISMLWSGAPICALRGFMGGFFYWGMVGVMLASFPTVGDFPRGFIAALIATVLSNPVEVILTTLLAPLPVSVRSSQLMRGTLMAVVRTLPSATVGYWLTCRCVDLINAFFKL